MRCPNNKCTLSKFTVSTGKYCNRCGTELVAQDTCVSCGSVLGPADSYCVQCSKKTTEGYAEDYIDDRECLDTQEMMADNERQELDRSMKEQGEWTGSSHERTRRNV